MNKTLQGLLKIVLMAMVMFLAIIVWGNFSERDVRPVTTDSPELVGLTPKPTITPPPTDNLNQEREIPEDFTSMRLAVAGDIVCHTGLNEEAKSGDTYDYTEIMKAAEPYIKNADYAIACLETTFAGGTNYTGYPMFKSPDGLAKSLSNIGLDLISTASNHCLDSHKAGLDRTLDVLEEAGLAHIGTYRTRDERDANNGIVTIERNDISIAFLAYTYGTNGLPVTGFEYAVNIFNSDYMTNLSEIDYDLIKKDMEHARELDTDFIAVIVHWGAEYQINPTKHQYELADFLFAEGADMVLGGHPHVPEPMELREVTDNEGKTKTGYVNFCMGNFISCQNDPDETRMTAIADIELIKDTVTGETFIGKVTYTPMYMVDLHDFNILDAGWRYRLWDVNKILEAHETGETLEVTSSELIEAVTKTRDRLREILGEEFDKQPA